MSYSPATYHHPMSDTYIISAEDNDEDVTKLVEHVAEKVDGVTVEVKEGGSIKMTGGASITMSSDGGIKIG